MEIKDYIHFYIGCEAKALIQYQENGGQWVNCKLVGIDNGIPKVRPRDIYGKDWEQDTLRNEVKPILRKLSDMTEEESAAMRKLFSEMADNDKAQGEIWADQTRHMIKQGFDLFGLIPAGLAIDKTSLKN